MLWVYTHDSVAYLVEGECQREEEERSPAVAAEHQRGHLLQGRHTLEF